MFKVILKEKDWELIQDPWGLMISHTHKHRTFLHRNQTRCSWCEKKAPQHLIAIRDFGNL